MVIYIILLIVVVIHCLIIINDRIKIINDRNERLNSIKSISDKMLANKVDCLTGLSFIVCESNIKMTRKD